MRLLCITKVITTLLRTFERCYETDTRRVISHMKSLGDQRFFFDLGRSAAGALVPSDLSRVALAAFIWQPKWARLPIIRVTVTMMLIKFCTKLQLVSINTQ